MGAVSQVIKTASDTVSHAAETVSAEATKVLQPIEKTVNQELTTAAKTISNSPYLEAAITAVAAAYGVPPAATASFLAANKYSQTGGNLEKAVETLVTSYGAGQLTAGFNGIDLSVAEEAAANGGSEAQIVNAAESGGSAGTTAISSFPNEAVATGTAPGSVGAQMAAQGALSTDAAAAAAGTSTPIADLSGGLSAMSGGGEAASTAVGGGGAAGTAVTAFPNESVAAGMSPGSVGAQMAAQGGLSSEAAAAAQGTVGAGSSLADMAAVGNTAALTGAAGAAGAGAGAASAGAAAGGAFGLTATQLAALGIGATGLYNSAATREAMQAGLGAQQAATAASQGTLSNIYNQQLGYQAPYQAAGVGAINQLSGMTPYLTHQFNAADLQAGLAPNYDFMLQQGQQANQRAANVGGGALGGNALTGLNQFTQNYAGNAYQNAFNNYQLQRTGIYNSLAGIAGIGQTANTGAGTAGQAYSTGTVGLNTGLANATAASMLGQSQASSTGLSNLANTAYLATLLGSKG